MELDLEKLTIGRTHEGLKNKEFSSVDLTKAYLEKIKKRFNNGEQISPNFNSESCLFFDKLSIENNICIQHAMNGGEYYIKQLGYWLDGYDKNNNVAYEWDEPHHFFKGELREKDLIRQIEIEKFLKCKFIRIKGK